jgi:hypothetical protein
MVAARHEQTWVDGRPDPVQPARANATIVSGMETDAQAAGDITLSWQFLLGPWLADRSEKG